MKTKTLVTTGLILSLLGSNIVIGQSYAINKYHNESLIKYQTQKVQKLEKIKELQSELIKSKSSDVEMLRDKTNEYLNNLDLALKENSTLKNKNTSLKDENTKLKKQLAKRKEANKQRKFYVEATAYTATCQEGCSGVTYTEIDVRNTIYYKGMRVIASDNTVLPLYSIVQVKTKNETFKAIVLDRGGGINNFEIDLLVRNEMDAKNFGRQKVLITVLKEGKS